MPLMTLHRQVVALRDLGADGGVRALDLVVDGLADVVEQAAVLAIMRRRPDLGGDDRRQARGLDRVAEHVLTVRGPVLQAAEQLDDLGGQPGDAGFVGGRSRPGAMTRSTSALALATTSSIRPGGCGRRR